MSDHEHDILCLKCNDSTCHPPPQFPAEYDGYCPQCALALMQAGELPEVPTALWAEQVLGRIITMLEEGTARLVTGDGFDSNNVKKIAEDENGCTFVHRVCLN